MSKNEITKGQEKLLNFFNPLETPGLKKSFKQVFEITAFDSDIAIEKSGKDSLFKLYELIELLSEIEDERNN